MYYRNGAAVAVMMQLLLYTSHAGVVESPSECPQPKVTVNVPTQRCECIRGHQVKDEHMGERVRDLEDKVRAMWSKDKPTQDDDVRPPPQADCKVEGKYCGSGEPPRDCREAYEHGCRHAITWIKPRGTRGLWVSCQGPWTIIQRRWDGETNFYRDWLEYKRGFPISRGSLNPSRDHWIGNDVLHALTSQRKDTRLRVDMWHRDSRLQDKEAHQYEEYATFHVGDEREKYKLQVAGANGTAGDCLAYHNGKKFTTYDQDNDKWSKNCATQYKGAWWYGSCHKSNLNGLYHHSGHHKEYATGVNWHCSHGYHYSLRSVMRVY